MSSPQILVKYKANIDARREASGYMGSVFDVGTMFICILIRYVISRFGWRWGIYSQMEIVKRENDHYPIWGCLIFRQNQIYFRLALATEMLTPSMSGLGNLGGWKLFLRRFESHIYIYIHIYMYNLGSGYLIYVHVWLGWNYIIWII